MAEVMADLVVAPARCARGRQSRPWGAGILPARSEKNRLVARLIPLEVGRECLPWKTMPPSGTSLSSRETAEHGGGYMVVKDYVRIARARGSETFVPLSHPSGHAQVDFGKAIEVIGGVRCKLHFFCMDLPQPGACFVKASGGGDGGPPGRSCLGLRLLRRGADVGYARAKASIILATLVELELIDREQRVVKRRIK